MSENVDVKSALDLFVGAVEKTLARHHPGVVYQNVHFAHFSFDSLRGPVNLFSFG